MLSQSIYENLANDNKKMCQLIIKLNNTEYQLKKNNNTIK